MQKLIKDEAIPVEDKERVEELKSLLRQEKAMPTDLLRYKDLFRKYG